MAKKLVQFEQLQKLTQGLYGKLHQELLDHDVKIDAHTTAITNALVEVNNEIAKKANQTDLTAEIDRAKAAEKANADAIKDLQDANTAGGAVANAIQAAKDAADAAQADVNALKGKVGTVADGKTVVGLIAEAKAQADKGVADAAAAQTTANENAQAITNMKDESVEGSLAKKIKTNADEIAAINNTDTGILAQAKADAEAKYATKGDLSGVSSRVTAAESDIDTIETALGKDAQGNIKSVDTRIQEAVNGVTDGALKEAQDDIAALEGKMATAEGNITSVTAKANANASAIEAINNADTGILKQAKGYTDQKVADLVNGAPDAMDTLNELAKAITDHQTVYDAYVQTVSTNLAKKVDVTTYETKVQALENADTALQGRATALEGIVGKKANEDGDATGLCKDVAKNTSDIAANKTAISALQGAIGSVKEVAAKDVLDAVSGRVETVETKVDNLETAVGKKAAGETPASGLYKEIADEATRAQGIEAGLRKDVDALKNTVGDAGKGLVKDVDDLQSAVANLQTSNHTHDNKTTLDAITATVKQGYDDAVAKVTGDAATEGTIANAKKAGTDAQAAVDGLKLGVDLTDDTKAVVQLKNKANAVQNSIEIVYPYEFVTDDEINALIAGLGK